MKVALAFLCLCGVMLSVDAACSINECTLSGAVTGTEACTTYQNFINCLTALKSGCTTAQNTAIDSAINANKEARKVLKCSATGLTVSVVTLLLSLVAAFNKL